MGIDGAGVQLDGAVEVGGGLLELALANAHLASVEVHLGVVGIDCSDAVERSHAAVDIAFAVQRLCEREQLGDVGLLRDGNRTGGFGRGLSLRWGRGRRRHHGGLRAGGGADAAAGVLQGFGCLLSLLCEGIVRLNGQDAGVVRDRQVIVAFDLVGVATLHEREDELRVESDRPIEVGERAVDFALHPVHAPAGGVGERGRRVDRDCLVEILLGALVVAHRHVDVAAVGKRGGVSRLELQGFGKVRHGAIVPARPDVHLASHGKRKHVLCVEVERAIEIGDGLVELVLAHVCDRAQAEGRHLVGLGLVLRLDDARAGLDGPCGIGGAAILHGVGKGCGTRHQQRRQSNEYAHGTLPVGWVRSNSDQPRMPGL